MILPDKKETHAQARNHFVGSLERNHDISFSSHGKIDNMGKTRGAICFRMDLARLSIIELIIII